MEECKERDLLDKVKLKQSMMLITYTCFLVLCLIYIKDIFSGIRFLLGLLTGFFIGIIIAFALNNIYEKVDKTLERISLDKRIRKFIGIFSSYAIIILIVASVIYIVIPQLSENMRMFVKNLDTYKDGLQSSLNQISNTFHLNQKDLSGIFGSLENYLGKFGQVLDNLMPQITTATIGLFNSIVNVCLGIGFSIYLLIDRDKILMQTRRLFQAFLPEKVYGVCREIYRVVVETFNNYIVGQCTEAIILGSLCFIGMLILRLDYAGMISAVIAITALIPILGAYIGGGVGFILLFMVSPKKAVIFVVFLLILQEIENKFIYPKVVGTKIGTPGIWILLGITIGGKAAGLVGMLFGVPTLSVIYILLKKSVLLIEENKKNKAEKKNLEETNQNR